MSKLQPNEIPTVRELRQMTADEIKHMATKYMEPYRILRAEFLTLTSTHWAVTNGKFPNEYDPVKWRHIWRLEHGDDAFLARLHPIRRLLYMGVRSKNWFLVWQKYERVVKVERGRLEGRMRMEEKKKMEEEENKRTHERVSSAVRQVMTEWEITKERGRMEVAIKAEMLRMIGERKRKREENGSERVAGVVQSLDKRVARVAEMR